MSFSFRLIALTIGNCLAVGSGLLVYNYFPNKIAAIICGFLVLVSITWLSYRIFAKPFDRFLQTLESALLHLKDGEFSLQVPEQQTPQFNQLGQLFNQVISNLRENQTHLLQRDLMLNRVFETVSSALVLTDSRQKIVLCNPTARHLLNEGKPVRGLSLQDLVATMPISVQESIMQQQNLMFTLEKMKYDHIGKNTSNVQMAAYSEAHSKEKPEAQHGEIPGTDTGEHSLTQNGETESWYLFCERFQLHGYEHCLYHFQPLTRALARSEVDTWKKVIRVFSHELNNSLAPVSSLAHSGLQLIQQSTLPTQQQDLLQKILTTVQERATHLRDFLSDYAQFSRLPTPAREPINWLAFLTNLQGLSYFRWDNNHAPRAGFADPAQLAQVLINLIKNAREAGASEEGVFLEIKPQGSWDMISISDDGSGMSEEQLKQAMLPFYSTKRDGAGLGLALCREIIEAHNGRIHFANRPGHGLNVSIWLPTLSLSAKQ
ncbi:MAG: hypothetical protein B0W54_00785 [Cellvibrio sp. 79]|nr:MAG: hypothetical protein B0W54_00785 [Cellvibrio sp. 79]